VEALAAIGRHRFKPKYKMTKYGCKHCGDVCQVYKIVSPSDLKKAIRVVQDNIADGIVIESDFWPQQNLKISHEPFSGIQVNGPYDDFLIYYFECPECKQLFQLSAETYHGSGGLWKPIDRDSL